MFQNAQERIASRRYKFPENLTDKIETQLSAIGFSVAKPGELARAIKRLSDFYLANPTAQTPWSEKWAQAAYLSYFFPLNFTRSQAVVDEALRVGFFDGLEEYLDFGCGLSGYGFLIDKMRGQFVDVASEPLRLLKTLAPPSQHTFSQKLSPIKDGATGLGIFSYVLTELKQLPSWAFDLEALLIVEPSTRDDGRRLQALRKDLLKRGYSAWGPCTHQQDCPLLEKSKTDWCHDRIFFEGAPWYAELEKLLPMKNRTITFSYLLVRKSPPKLKSRSDQNLGRLVGDRLPENGKTRQLYCRGADREFVSWLHKFGEPPVFYRGQLLEIPSDIEKKGDELRIKPS